jgi:hypothetical protein
VRNVESVMEKLGGIERFVGKNDVVLVKVSAQWWNQGMTNVAAVRRFIELVLAIPGFAGEVIVFENTHFLSADGSSLNRAFSHPSDRNVDVPGFDKMGDLFTYFARERADAPVSFVGLVDAAKSVLANDHWHDPEHPPSISTVSTAATVAVRSQTANSATATAGTSRRPFERSEASSSTRRRRCRGRSSLRRRAGSSSISRMVFLGAREAAEFPSRGGFAGCRW